MMALGWLFLPGLVACAELEYPPVKLASEGTHTLSLGQVSLIDASTGLTTRGFNGGIPGPTFRMKPGETLYVNLENSLTTANDVSCAQTGSNFCKLSTTNLHMHGLHVSSKGKRDGYDYSMDDVFVVLEPGETEAYRFPIPSYHMGGTHWYHPHHHHSAALQAGGGAVGLVVVEDPDGYLSEPYSSMVEKLLMITLLAFEQIETMADSSQSNLLSDAASQAANVGLGTQVVLVNGQLSPTISIQSHQWHRFRMAFNALEQEIYLSTTVGNLGSGGSCQLELLAKDGVYLNSMPRSVSTIVLCPGARADVAVSCTCASYPCSVDVLGTSCGGVPGACKDAADATSAVRGLGQVKETVWTVMISETVDGSTADLPTVSVSRPCYLADLQTATVPSTNQHYVKLGNPYINWNSQGDTSMTYDSVHANGGTMLTWPSLATLTVGNVYEFTVKGLGAHAMHFHVNNFQITDMPDPGSAGAYFQVGDWHDSLWLGEIGGSESKVRMALDVFTGKMVLHCHIMEHEDNGMMGWLEIDGTEGDVYDDATTIDQTCYNTAFDSGSSPSPSPSSPSPTASDPSPSPSPSTSPSDSTPAPSLTASDANSSPSPSTSPSDSSPSSSSTPSPAPLVASDASSSISSQCLVSLAVAFASGLWQ